MKAMRFFEANEPLELVELPNPAPGPGWVVLDVKAAGICHSDLHVLDGSGIPWLDKMPITLGHEVAGTVALLGDGVTGFAIGDRVGVANLSHPEDRAAANQVRSGPGMEVDGGYAEQCMIHSSALVPIPDGVSFASAALAADAIATAYHAVRTTADVRAGHTVGIIGLGGLGMSGLRTAVLCGASGYGVDVNTATFDDAKCAGAIECFSDVADLEPLHPDVIIDFVGTSATIAAALKAVGGASGGRGWSGTVVVVGLATEHITVSATDLIHGHKTLRGSLGATKDELRQVYDFLAAGELVPVVEEVPLPELNSALKRLERREVTGHRLVAVP